MEENDPWTIHYSELPPGRPGEALTVEWDCYRREAGRLLAEGHEERWVLIKGEEIVGIFDTCDAARDEAYRRWPYPREPFLMHQIQTRERILRVSWRLMAGSCHTSP